MANQNFTSLIAEIDRTIDSGNRAELGRLQMELFGAVETVLEQVGQDDNGLTWQETAEQLKEIEYENYRILLEFTNVIEQLEIADNRWMTLESNL